jgi:LPXTG-motif cell wall-anchored protein
MAFPNILPNTGINSVAVYPLTMILFPGASSVLLVLFFFGKKTISQKNP